jgi:acetyl-CoA C-acetyltransferase
MHSIVTMMERLRATPGQFGLVTANGWFVTKHAAGIYSTSPKIGPWEREDPAHYQRDLDAASRPAVAERPSGPGRIETYTVVHDRDGPKFGLIIGRLDNGQRFLAHSDPSREALVRLMEKDYMGAPGTVSTGEKTNLFTPS